MKIPKESIYEILRSGKVNHPNGHQLKLTSASAVEECEAMYRFILNEKPKHVIEIGMAYGISALTILTALETNQKGSLISIDPYPSWESARLTALHNIEKEGLSKRHEHLHLPSELALPMIINRGIQADFVYIDGHHGFDHAFVDWFFADKLVGVGGVIAFDDSRWHSVNKVIKYLLKHREYEEIDSGIKPETDLRSLAAKLIHGRKGPSRYFRKSGTWAAPYNFFKHF